MLTNVIKCLFFVLLSALASAAWMLTFEAVFPIAPVLYSVSGWLSI